MITMQLNRLPIALSFHPQGLIAFQRLTDAFGNELDFRTIIDNPEVGVQAIISVDDVFIGAETVLQYGEFYEYKQMPELLAWLKAQEMIMPRFN